MAGPKTKYWENVMLGTPSGYAVWGSGPQKERSFFGPRRSGWVEKNLYLIF